MIFPRAGIRHLFTTFIPNYRFKNYTESGQHHVVQDTTRNGPNGSLRLPRRHGKLRSYLHRSGLRVPKTRIIIVITLHPITTTPRLDVVPYGVSILPVVA